MPRWVLLYLLNMRPCLKEGICQYLILRPLLIQLKLWFCYASQMKLCLINLGNNKPWAIYSDIPPEEILHTVHEGVRWHKESNRIKSITIYYYYYCIRIHSLGTMNIHR